MIETGSYSGELEIMMGGNLGKGKFVRFVSIDHQAGSELRKATSLSISFVTSELTPNRIYLAILIVVPSIQPSFGFGTTSRVNRQRANKLVHFWRPSILA